MAFGYGLCENAVIVAAHPDDEILWFSSVMRQAQQVIILYRDFWADPGIGARRAEAIRNMPHPDVVWMEMTEAGACGLTLLRLGRCGGVGGRSGVGHGRVRLRKRADRAGIRRRD